MVRQFADDQNASVDVFSVAPRGALQAYFANLGKDLTLRWGQLKRAARRQAGVFLAIALAGVLLGQAYAYFYGADATASLVWAAFGLICAYSVAVTRELSRNAIGLLSSVKRGSGYSVLGAAPELTKQNLRDLPPDRRNPLGSVLYQPASTFAAAFRDLQSIVAQRQLVAFIGSVPNEGATTAALCSAVTAVQQGKRVLIVDCDLRRRSLTRMLECEVEQGVFEAAQQPDAWRSLVQQEEESGLYFLPAAKLRNPWRNLFSQPSLPALFAKLREHYDLIILDCPPALTITDGAMIARGADSCIIVAAWDETPVAALRATMRALRSRTPIPTGVCVNRVPPHYRFEPKVGVN
ncbi:MAG TPA: CpsD/CapB family tyrosine-protein kinase [Caulobacterales bacterium]|nr:CpsD/CapB family tyrosine-protein kinase [Caulobacterales bacterium]